MRRFRRVTRDGHWIPEIDGLRFVAIALVILFHLVGELDARNGKPIYVEPRYGWLHAGMANGDRGVGLFFVISGMILAMPFARQYLLKGRPVSMRKYYMRRLSRLEPPYLLSLVLWTLLVLIAAHGLPAGFGKEVAANAFYLHSLIYGHLGVNPVIWSLEVEVQFYLLAPVIMLVFLIPGKLRRRGLLLAGMLGMGLLQMDVGWIHSSRGEASLVYFLQYFAAGLIIADVFVLDLDRMKTSLLWDAAVLAALIGLLSLSTKWSAHICVPFLCIVLCIGVMRSVIFRVFFRNDWITVTGGMCYSIYLMHFAIIAAVFRYSRRLLMPQFDFLLNYSIQLVAVGVPILAWSVAYYLLVERPCMDPNWPNKLWMKMGRQAQID